MGLHRSGQARQAPVRRLPHCQGDTGLTFVYASIHKILDPIAFAEAVNNYRILPAGLINLTALVLPWIELIAGTLLLLNVWVPGAALVVCGLLVIFTGAITLNMARGLDIACGCFTTSSAKGGMNLLTLCRDSSFSCSRSSPSWSFEAWGGLPLQKTESHPEDHASTGGAKR